MRIGIISVIHESNSFISTPMTIDLFQREALVTGEDMLRHYEDSHHETAGFIKGVRDAGEEAVPLFGAWGMPTGPLTKQTFDTILEMMFAELDKAGALDGMLVAPHGAAVSEEHLDMDGYWLTLLREKVGPDMPIICTLDPHTNLSHRMIDACNATIVYRSNPHMDQYQIGLQAADLLMRTLQGKVKPTQAAAYPPVAINIEKQETAISPCKEMYEFANSILERDKVISNSVVLGFAYSDVEEMGSSFIVVTDNDPALAQQYADEMADYLWEHRQDFVANLIGIEQAIDMALKTDGPVCLLDMGDNVGGGSSADSTFIAHAIDQRRGPKTFIAINDPQSVEQAVAAGIGATIDLRVGGKTDNLHGKPLEATFTVRKFHDGEFHEPRPRHGGRTRYHMGLTAVVETEYGLTVQLTSARTAPISLHQLHCCDIDPTKFQILVAKGVVAPVTAYSEVCQTMIRVNTRGTTTADIESFDYKRRRRPLFPLEENTTFR